MDMATQPGLSGEPKKDAPSTENDWTKPAAMAIPSRNVNVPNNILLMGIDFDYTPVRRLGVFGRNRWISCCGGGWHDNESEFGAKHYLRRNFSVLGGFRYYHLKRDFSAVATTVTTGEGDRQR